MICVQLHGHLNETRTKSVGASFCQLAAGAPGVAPACASNSNPSKISHLPADQGSTILHHLVNFSASKFHNKMCGNWTIPHNSTQIWSRSSPFNHQILSECRICYEIVCQIWSLVRRVNCLRWCRSMGGHWDGMPKDIRQLNLIYQVAQPPPTFWVNKYSSLKTVTSWTFSTRLRAEACFNTFETFLYLVKLAAVKTYATLNEISANFRRKAVQLPFILLLDEDEKDLGRKGKCVLAAGIYVPGWILCPNPDHCNVPDGSWQGESREITPLAPGTLGETESIFGRIEI